MLKYFLVIGLKTLNYANLKILPEKQYHFSLISLRDQTRIGKTSNENIKKISSLIDQNPDTEVHLDVANSKIITSELTFSVDIPPGAREALTEGRWDPIAELQEAEEAVDDVVNKLGYAI